MVTVTVMVTVLAASQIEADSEVLRNKSVLGHLMSGNGEAYSVVDERSVPVASAVWVTDTTDGVG